MPLLYAHIGAGLLGILVGLGAIFAPKLGRVHRRCGRAFVWVVVFIATSGCVLLADPAFGSIGLLFFSDKTGLGEVLQSAKYFEVMFLWLTFATLYVTLTGPRVWTRIRASNDGRMTSNWLDWALALAAVPMSVMFLVIGIIDLTHGERFGVEFIFFSLALDAFVLFDIVTFVIRPSVRRFPWWIVHMVKMLLAFDTLVYAVYLRHFLQLPKFLQLHFFVLYLAIPMIGICLWIHRRRLMTGPVQ